MSGCLKDQVSKLGHCSVFMLNIDFLVSKGLW